jgi:hypothetical protein
MGNSKSIEKINFEDVQLALKNPDKYIFINTLDSFKQDCLLPNTISYLEEEAIINNFISKGFVSIKIIVYGENSCDERVFVKANQLISLGFPFVYVYCGGIFEWLLLQDIYGKDEFPSTLLKPDLLKFKPAKKFGIHLLEYSF